MAIIQSPTPCYVTAHLENSLEPIQTIQSGDITTNKEFPYGCGLDVSALYTSVPIHEAITDAINRINNRIVYLTKQDMEDLLNIILKNMYFTFEDQVFL